MSTTTQTEVNHAEEQAKAQLESIVEMVAALQGDDQEQARETIQGTLFPFRSARIGTVPARL